MKKILLAVAMALLAASIEEPSVCTEMSDKDSRNGFMESFVITAGLPEGATVEGALPDGRTGVKYRGRTHAVK